MGIFGCWMNRACESGHVVLPSIECTDGGPAQSSLHGQNVGPDSP